MKKLIINGLLLFVGLLIVIAFFMALFRLRAVDETENAITELEQSQDTALSEQKAIEEQTAVKVHVANQTSNSSDVDDFLSEVG